MARDQRVGIEVPADNYGRLYIGVLEQPLTCHAKLAYGVLWSFGVAGCWASVASIARRMSVSPNTARKAIDELALNGWAEEVGEAKGTTRRWRLKVPTPGAAPLQELKGGASGAEGVPLQEVKPKQEGKQEGKQTAAKAATQEALTWMLYFKQRWTAKTGDQYVNEPGSAKAIQALQAQGVTLDTFKAKVEAYLAMDADEYVARSRWALLVLLRWRWNGLQATKAPKTGQGPELAI